MPTAARRWIALAAGIALLLLVAWLIHGRDPSLQAAATFERIKEAVEGNDAKGVVGELHPRYDFAGNWPGYFGGEVASAAGDSEPRGLARRGIAVIFMQRGENRLRFAYRIVRIAPQPDGTVAVDASIELSSQNGGGRLIPPVVHHWVLAPDGWLLGRMRILSHDRFAIDL